jgi:AraC-like DNA-binding protein
MLSNAMNDFGQHKNQQPQEVEICPAGDSPVRVGPMVNIAPVLAELGQDANRVFNRVGLKTEWYSDPDAQVSYLRCGRLSAEAALATACDHFGLLVGQASKPSHLGMVGFLVRTAETVEEALCNFIDYLDLHDRGGTLNLNTTGKYSQLSFHVHQLGMEGIDQVYDLCAAIMHRIMQSLCGENWAGTEVLLPREEPADQTPYRKLFRTVIKYDAESCAIIFPCKQLGRKSSTADALLFRYLKHEAEILHRIRDKELTDNLPAVIRHALLTDSFSAREIAQQMGFTERTFHRQLKAAGTSFRAEIDKERMVVSMQLLEVTSLAISDVAQSTGYSCTSSFNRAFRRWVGMTPTSWRKRKNSPCTQRTSSFRNDGILAQS